MKLTVTSNLVVVGKSKGEYQGKPTYKLAVAQEGEAGSVRAIESVYNAVDLYKPYLIECVLNDQYGTLTAQAILNSNSTDKK